MKRNILYYHNNKECVSIVRKEWRLKNRDSIAETTSDYYQRISAGKKEASEASGQYMKVWSQEEDKLLLSLSNTNLKWNEIWEQFGKTRTLAALKKRLYNLKTKDLQW